MKADDSLWGENILDIIYSIRYFMVDIRRGIYSDIPMCCILWYVTIWPIFLYFKLNEWYVPTFLENFNFIACPKCIMLYENTEKMIKPKPIPNEKRFMYKY